MPSMYKCICFFDLHIPLPYTLLKGEYMKTYALDIETVANQGDKYFQNRKWNDLISIAIVNVDDTTEQYYWSVRPPEEYYQSTGWWDGHGLSWDTQADKPTLDQIWPQIYEILDGHTVVAHNAFGFDRDAVIISARHYNLPLPNTRWIDTKYEARGTWNLDRSESSLASLCTKYTEYDKDGHHNALQDTLMLAKLYKFMTSKPEFDYLWKVKTTSNTNDDKALADVLFTDRCPF